MIEFLPCDPNLFEGDDRTVAQRLRLLEELEIFARQLTPDYVPDKFGVSLEDSSHGCATSGDMGGKLFTELGFTAHRHRGMSFDETTGLSYPSAPIGVSYTANSLITLTVDQRSDFPSDVTEVLESDEDLEEVLKESDIVYAIALAQGFALSTNGDYSRTCQLRFVAGDAFLYNDLTSDDPTLFGLAKPPAADAAEKGSVDLRDLLGDDISSFLSSLDEGMESKAGKKPTELFYGQIDSVRNLTEVQEHQLLRGLLRQIPVNGIAAADAA